MTRSAQSGNERLGQLLMAGFEGRTPSKPVEKLLRTQSLGGVILFRRNLKDPAQVAHLCADLQKRSSRPLLIAVDEEGGRVSRLPEGFTHFPAAAAMAGTGSVKLVYRAAECIAQQLKTVGINMNLAPVLDVNTQPQNPVIGDRAYGTTSTAVSTYGLSAMAALQDNGIIACGKHFPGHGDTTADSHHELPAVAHGIKRLMDVEVRPFHHAIQNGLATIMTAHVLYPALDKAVPATLSKRIVTGFLRGMLKFQGVVVTDDLRMKAISKQHGLGEAAVMVIEAGADLVLICEGEEEIPQVIEALAQAVQSGRLTEARIQQSLGRLQQLRDRFLTKAAPPNPREVKRVIGSDAHKRLLEEIRSYLHHVGARAV
jgi:beta-N-acetylhexosaminidase